MSSANLARECILPDVGQLQDVAMAVALAVAAVAVAEASSASSSSGDAAAQRLVTCLGKAVSCPLSKGDKAATPGARGIVPGVSASNGNDDLDCCIRSLRYIAAETA